MIRFLLFFALLALQTGRLCPPLFAAQTGTPRPALEVRVGFDNASRIGCYKNGLWTPVTLESSEPLGQFTIRCSDGDGVPITYHYDTGTKTDKDCPSAVRKTTVLAKLGRAGEPLIVTVNGHPHKIAVPPPVNAERPIYLVIGSEDIGLQGAIAELALREDRRPMLVKVKSLADLPDKWFGYEAVEMIVLTTTEPSLFTGGIPADSGNSPHRPLLTKDSPQIKALNDWLKLGGKMLLCAGSHAGLFLEPEDGLLRPFLPGQFTGMTELRSGTPLETFVGSKRQIYMNGTKEAPFMKMPRFVRKTDEPAGMTLVQDGDLPLVLRCAHGFGTLIYFGGDLAHSRETAAVSPLANWRDRVALVRSIMQWNTEGNGRRNGSQIAGHAGGTGGMLQLGYNDITGQIRSALDHFEGVRVVPFSVILVILTAYWLIVGLFDWFFVHKVLKRPVLTWLTFPCWIVLFCVLTCFLAARGRPAEDKENCVRICDNDSVTNLMRVCRWETLYSTKDKVIERRHTNDTVAGETRDGYFSWNGLPGSGLGGMAPKTISPSVWTTGYEQVSYTDLRRLPMQVRSTKSVFSMWFDRDYQALPVVFESDLADEEGVPVGTVTAPRASGFGAVIGTEPVKPGKYENTVLIYGRWMLELGRLQAGETVQITRTTPRREVQDLLIPPAGGSGLSGAAGISRALAAYNPQSGDLNYILRVMTLHRHLGGYEATGLHHAYMPWLDMSDLLSADRCLLLTTDAESSVFSLVRQPLPIKLTELSPRLNRTRNEYKPDALDDNLDPAKIKGESNVHPSGYK
ncbi:MAG: hypothetical protein LBH00_00710 [Planctomycetaceae bacterium]|jgi:hypothetical protein|nr:hypothetical protein [Planctomycetaceae bacterium]